MKVKTLKLFGDGKRLYKENEIVDMDEEWYETLNSTPNGPLLEKVEDDNENFPKHIGGGQYLLSNGEKIKGKKEALEAEEAINKENQDDK